MAGALLDFTISTFFYKYFRTGLKWKEQNLKVLLQLESLEEFYMDSQKIKWKKGLSKVYGIGFF